MPRWLEFEDKNVEKAVKRACEELNIPKDKMKYDVISYGSSGIFGLVGTKKARIRVSLPDVDAEKKQDANVVPPEDVKEEAIAIEPAEETKETTETPDGDESPADPADIGRLVIQTIIDQITSDASISVEKTAERILFNIKGGNAGVLIGKRGQTLEAIHYLVEKILNKKTESHVRIQIDVEGYLETRKSSLTRLAERLAQKSKKTGKPMTIGQMNAHDRRIVHLALKEDGSVRTQSMGDGYYRKLVIFPKKQGAQKRR